MKKMRFAVWFAALLTMVTFSSCLDSEDGGQRQGSEIVKVTGMMGMYSFQSAGGYELVPSNMSQITMDINTEFALVVYSYDSGQVTDQTKRIPVELLSILPIERHYINDTLEGMKEYGNAPIRAISAGGSMEFFPISFWNPTTMFLPINYFVKDSANKDEILKEVNSHSFEIFSDVNDTEAMDGQMILHVRHRVVDPSLNKERRYKYNTNIYHVDLSQSVYEFESMNGKKPETIIVKYEESTVGDYDPSYMTEGRAEINYRQIIELAPKK